MIYSFKTFSILEKFEETKSEVEEFFLDFIDSGDKELKINIVIPKKDKEKLMGPMSTRLINWNNIQLLIQNSIMRINNIDTSTTFISDLISLKEREIPTNHWRSMSYIVGTEKNEKLFDLVWKYYNIPYIRISYNKCKELNFRNSLNRMIKHGYILCLSTSYGEDHNNDLSIDQGEFYLLRNGG